MFFEILLYILFIIVLILILSAILFGYLIPSRLKKKGGKEPYYFKKVSRKKRVKEEEFALIFDLATLVDFEKSFLRSVILALSEFDININSIDDLDYVSLLNKSEEEILVEICHFFGKEFNPQMKNITNEHFKHAISTEYVCAREFSVEVLEKLNKFNRVCTLVSKFSEENIKYILTGSGISTSYFHPILSFDKEKSLELLSGSIISDSDILLKIPRKYKILPSQCCFIGNNPAGIQTAINSGMSTIAICTNNNINNNNSQNQNSNSFSKKIFKEIGTNRITNNILDIGSTISWLEFDVFKNNQYIFNQADYDTISNKKIPEPKPGIENGETVLRKRN